MSPARSKTPIVVAVIVALVVLAIVFIGDPQDLSDEGAVSDKPQAGLIVISPHSDSIKTEFRRAFRKWSAENLDAEVVIEWKDHGGTMDSIRYVHDRFESSPTGIDHDLFFGGGVDPFLEFKRRGLLERVEVAPEILDRIPQAHEGMEVYDADLEWFGACMSGFGILYNKQMLRRYDLPAPETWTDLGSPKYFGLVSSADMRKSGSVHMAYEIMFQGLGWDAGWSASARLAGNSRAFESGASDIINSVRSDNAACGMAIDYYAMAAVQALGRENAGFVLPEKLTVINPDGMAVLKGAPNMKYAKAFVEFVLSDAGQMLWVLKPGVPGGPSKEGIYRKSVVPGFADQFGDDAFSGRDPFTYKAEFVFDSAKASRRWSIFGELLGAWTVDTHKELVGAWEAVKDLPDNNARKAEFLRPPVTEGEIENMLDRWGDPKFREDTSIRWREEAKSRYQRIAGSN